MLLRTLHFVRALLAQRDLAVLLFCNVLIGVAYSFVVPFLSMFGTREVGMTPVTFGIFMTVTSIGSVVCSTVLSRWSDVRLARKTVLLIGGTSGALGYLGYAYVRDVFSLTLIGIVLLGIASVTFSQLFAYARDLLARTKIPASEIPLYMNVFRLAFALSWTVGPALAAWVMVEYSFRGTFLVAALFFVLFVLFVAFLVPNVAPTEDAQKAAAALPLLRALRQPGLVPHLVAFTLYFACSTMGMMNLPLLILDSLSGTPAQVGWAYSVAPLFEIPLMVYIGILATRMDQGRLIRAALTLAIVYYGCLAIVGQPSHVYPLQILSAAIVAVTSGVAITFFQDFLPSQPGSATNLYSNAQRIGGTSGYLAFGLLTQAFGARGVFVACSCLCLLSVLILLAFRPRAVPAAI